MELIILFSTMIVVGLIGIAIEFHRIHSQSVE